MTDDEVPWWKRRRYWLSALFFCGYSIFTIIRANLSIIIVCMVKHGGPQNSSHVTSYNTSDLSNITDGIHVAAEGTDSCPARVHTDNTDIQDGEFEWDKELQGVLLGGYFWGYSCGLQVLGGWLCQRYGARLMVTLGVFPSAIGCLLSPLAARVSPYLFLAVRVISGATITVIFASVPVFWSRWAPPDEWGRLLASTYAGGEFGHAIAFLVNGLLCRYGGWELPFYVVGAVGVTWCIVWFAVCRDCPSQMPGITEAEKLFIQTAVAERTTQTRRYRTPWKSIFTSIPVWACVCAHVTVNFFFYMLLTQGPTYLKEIMHFDIASNGLFSSLPYIGLVSLMVPLGMASDWLVSRGYLSLGGVRKLFNSLGQLIPSVFLLALAYLPCSDQAAGVALITAAVATFACCYCGHIVNMADIAVMHSGIVAGFSNTLASMPGFVAPYVVAHLTKQGTQEEWRTAFFIGIALNVIGAIVFLLFSSGSPQAWALPENLNMTASLPAPDETGDVGQELRTFVGSSNSVTNSHGKDSIEGEKLIQNGGEYDPVVI